MQGYPLASIEWLGQDFLLKKSIIGFPQRSRDQTTY
jgi:hypothetical protein